MLLPKDDIPHLVAQAQLVKAQHIIFTSQRAACLSLPFIGNLSSRTYCYAVGASTFETLAQWTSQHPFWCNNHQIMLPSAGQYHSEGLLALPRLHKVNGEDVVIIKGDNGRPLLSETLTARGATVRECAVYSRENLATAESTHTLTMDAINTIVITSNEQIEQAFRIFPEVWLRGLQWVVVSERAAQHLRALSLTRIHIATGASDTALIQTVKNI